MLPTPPPAPVTVFLSPPFPDLEEKPDELLAMLRTMQEKLAPGSVLVAQLELCPMMEEIPLKEEWDHRKYGRNHLLFWVKPLPSLAPEPTP